MEILHALFSRNVTRLRYLVAGTVLILASFPLRANVILPGGSVSPDVFSNPGSTPTLLSDITGTFSFGSGPGFAHRLVGGSRAGRSPFGVTCAGCLDLLFQVTEDHFAVLRNLRHWPCLHYFGYTTDVGYVDRTGITPHFDYSRTVWGRSQLHLLCAKRSDKQCDRAGWQFPPSFTLPATNATTYEGNGACCQ